MADAGGQDRVPGVSIGLPVFNGGALLQNAIEQLLAQEYSDFELIISDNASTDQTEEICRAFAAKDFRIRYQRRDRNYGITENFKHVLKLARATYFMWAAYDDQFHPKFICTCKQRLDMNPSLVMVAPAVQFVTVEGELMDHEYPPLHTVGMDIRSKVATIFNEWGIGYNTYGLYRRAALCKINLDIKCWAGDVLILLQLLFLGEVEHVPERLFTYRYRKRSNADLASLLPDEKYQLDKKFTALTINLFRAIFNASVNPALRCLLVADALEIIVFKNRFWLNYLVLDNEPFFQHIVPPGTAFLTPEMQREIISGLAVLLLPFCAPGVSFEDGIDWSSIDGFDRLRLDPTVAAKRKENLDYLTKIAGNDRFCSEAKKNITDEQLNINEDAAHPEGVGRVDDRENRVLANEKVVANKTTVSLIQMFRTILAARGDPALRRLLLYDAFEAVVINSELWQENFLAENESILSFVDAGQNGFFPQKKTNLTALAASILLPFCSHPGENKGLIDRAVFEGFKKIVPEQRAKPCPGVKEFITILSSLLENKMMPSAMAFYSTYRRFMPQTKAVCLVDTIMKKLGG